MWLVKWWVCFLWWLLLDGTMGGVRMYFAYYTLVYLHVYLYTFIALGGIIITHTHTHTHIHTQRSDNQTHTHHCEALDKTKLEMAWWCVCGGGGGGENCTGPRQGLAHATSMSRDIPLVTGCVWGWGPRGGAEEGVGMLSVAALWG
jgi:hypothetical protein